MSESRAVVVYQNYYIEPDTKKLNRTICDVIRELYRDAKKRDDPLSMTRLQEAHNMAKRMQAKLKQYSLKAEGPVYLMMMDNGTLHWVTKARYKRLQRRKRL